MNQQIEIEVQNTQDVDATKVVAFLETAGKFKIRRRSIAARGENEIVQVILLIVGQWAAERYILDPLADRLDEWIEAIQSLKGKQFRVSITFQHGRLGSIETFRFSNPLIVGNIWRLIKSASDLLANHAEEIPLDRVLIVPGKLEEPLVIGYQGTRPTHLLDISSSSVMPVNTYDSKSMGEIEPLV